MNVSGSKRTRYMECITMKITEDIIYVGVNDHDVDLFEGQYIVPNGMAYNSYVIRDEKIAVMDTVDGRFANACKGTVNCGASHRLLGRHWMVQHRII